MFQIQRHTRNARHRFPSLPLLRRVAASAQVASICGILVASFAPTLQAAPHDRPNVVVILADDQGWGDLSVHGNTNLATPHIDSLAGDGALFEHFYVCAVCAPTRAEFLTGRYHPRGGVRGVSKGEERLDLDETTIADLFRTAGYATGAFGKWHNGTQPPYHPNDRGFDEYYGFCSGHWGHYFDPVLEHNGELVRGKGFIIDDLTDHAIAFIEQNRDRPFFCYVPYNTPHSPMQVPDRFFNRFAGADFKMHNRDPQREDLAMTRAALAMCENIDWNVGRILQKLDQSQLTDNTIVLFFSDNGPNSWRYNGGMRGRKGSVYEGGLRVPCLIRWPGRIQPGTRISQIAGAIDLLPTFADMTGVSTKGTKPIDGISLRPLLENSDNSWPDRMLYSMWRGKVTVRTQQYRLDSEGQLYDITADTGEHQDVAAARPEVATRLRKALAEWAAEMRPQVGPDDRPFPVGAGRITQLPARDGIATGTIRRSARAPNCSYFANWTRSGDRLAWDVEVARAGDFEVVLYYTCPADSIGSTVDLSYGENHVRAVIAEAHDPPEVGASFDRVERKGESYVKDFRPLRLGTIYLTPGRGQLVLRAVDIPHQQVAEIRSVLLIRKER